MWWALTDPNPRPVRVVGTATQTCTCGGTVGVVQRVSEETWDEIGDDELSALALAADPETEVNDDAVPLTGSTVPSLLPDWYMPAPMGGVPLLQGWRRRVGQLIVASFLLINAYGMCSTYGWVGFG